MNFTLLSTDLRAEKQIVIECLSFFAEDWY